MMKNMSQRYMHMWSSIGTRWLPFADAASDDEALPLPLLLPNMAEEVDATDVELEPEV